MIALLRYLVIQESLCRFSTLATWLTKTSNIPFQLRGRTCPDHHAETRARINVSEIPSKSLANLFSTVGVALCNIFPGKSSPIDAAPRSRYNEGKKEDLHEYPGALLSRTLSAIYKMVFQKGVFLHVFLRDVSIGAVFRHLTNVSAHFISRCALPSPAHTYNCLWIMKVASAYLEIRPPF